MPAAARPSGVEFGGQILVAYQNAPISNNVVKVSSFTLSGSTVATSHLTASGYVQPVLADTGANAYLVIVKKASPRAVVSQAFNGLGWSPLATEISAQATNGDDFAYPNTMTESPGRLRFLVDGKRCPTKTSKNAVLGYDRAA